MVVQSGSDSSTNRIAQVFPSTWLQYIIERGGSPSRFMFNFSTNSDKRTWITPKTYTSFTTHKTNNDTSNYNSIVIGIK